MDILTLFSIAILIISVVIHEVAHGYAALWQGDPTAKYAGRLTLNPIKHIDPFGSVILPLLLAILPGNFIVGWAKPVPYNPYNLRNQKFGELLVAIAGPISNMILAALFGTLYRYGAVSGFDQPILEIMLVVVVINVALAVFNMMPVPPLDGSKVLFALLPAKYKFVREFLERNTLLIIVLFLIFAGQIISPFIYFFVRIFTGL